jgi:hypothetical protein
MRMSYHGTFDRYMYLYSASGGCVGSIVAALRSTVTAVLFLRIAILLSNPSVLHLHFDPLRHSTHNMLTGKDSWASIRSSGMAIIA